MRELARTLNVSPATAAAAYRLLRLRGLTTAQGRRGTRVVRPAALTTATASIVVPENAVDLSSGNPDPSLLPSLAGALRTIDTEPILYDRGPHLGALLTFAASEFEADRIPATAITIVSGALDALDRVLREHLRPGDHVAIEDPCFPAIRDLLRAGGYTAVPFTLDAEGPQAASLGKALQQHCRALIVTARAQNPMGAGISAARADELRSLLRRYADLLLIESDPCGPVAGVPLASLVDSKRARWAHIKSTAKFLGPDLRVGFLAADPLTAHRVHVRHAAGPRRVSYILQQLVLSLWSDPSAGRQLARASEIYRHRREALCQALASRGIAAYGASGLNVWIPVERESAAVASLAERGWVVAGGEPFRLHTAPGLRVTVSTLEPADAERLAGDVAAAFGRDHRPLA